jgi:uncharacterized SAM-binding protein YcdF (DUF218 family)
MTASQQEGPRARPFATGAVVGAWVGLVGRDLDLRAIVSWWHDVHVLVPVLAAAAALTWSWPLLRRAWTGAAIVLSMVWLAAAFTPLSRALETGLVRRDAPAPADAVFVLASSIQKDGELSTTAMSRLLHGLELIGAGQSRHLVLSELRPPARSYAEPARALIEHLRLAADLATVGPVDNTHDEAVLVARLSRERGWKRLLVVTSPVHSRRACAAFEKAGVEVTCTPSVETRYDLETLHEPADRLIAFGAALHERLGLWIYARRGWI